MISKNVDLTAIKYVQKVLDGKIQYIACSFVSKILSRLGRLEFPRKISDRALFVLNVLLWHGTQLDVRGICHDTGWSVQIRMWEQRGILARASLAAVKVCKAASVQTSSFQHTDGEASMSLTPAFRRLSNWWLKLVKPRNLLILSCIFGRGNLAPFALRFRVVEYLCYWRGVQGKFIPQHEKRISVCSWRGHIRRRGFWKSSAILCSSAFELATRTSSIQAYVKRKPRLTWSIKRWDVCAALRRPNGVLRNS